METFKSSVIFSHIFNTYDLFLLTTFVLALFMALPLFLKRDRTASEILLALFLLSQGFYAFYTVMIHSEVIGPMVQPLLFPFQKTLALIILGIQGLLLSWYCKVMMGKPADAWTSTTGYMLAFVFIIVAINIWLNWIDMYSKLNSFICGWLLNFVSVAIGVKAIMGLKRYEIQLPFVYSNLDKHSLSWLKIISVGFVSVWIISLTAAITDLMGARTLTEGLYLFRHIPPLILMSVMVVYGLTHTVSSIFNMELPEEKKPESENFTVSPQLTSQLNDLMERVKVYQDPELRLEGLADSLGISPRSLSTLLNKHYKQCFYDFVNQYRIIDAREQLHKGENKQKTIQRIFEDAGFNSKTTFYTLFKKHTNMTPSQYRSQLSL